MSDRNVLDELNHSESSKTYASILSDMRETFQSGPVHSFEQGSSKYKIDVVPEGEPRPEAWGRPPSSQA